MAIAFVNAISAGNDSVSSVSTGNLAVTAGNLIVIGGKFRQGSSTATMSVSSSPSLTWNQVGGQLDNTSNLALAMWYAVATATGNATFTLSTGGVSVRLPALSVTQYSGTSATPYDTSATGTTTNFTVTSGSFTPSTNGLAVAAVTSYNSGDPYTAGSGYTSAPSSEESYGQAEISEYLIGTGTSSQTASMTSSGTIVSIIVATFEASGGGGGSSTPHLRTLMGVGI